MKKSIQLPCFQGLNTVKQGHHVEHRPSPRKKRIKTQTMNTLHAQNMKFFPLPQDIQDRITKTQLTLHQYYAGRI